MTSSRAEVSGAAEDKWCPQEGATVLSLLHRLDAAGMETPDLYIVTPFVIVADNLRRMLTDRGAWPRRWGDDPAAWARERGDVHTVQGREAEAVIFVLGAPGPQQDGARRWAGGRPNLLNVAVTRAKEVVYVVGNRRLWKVAGVFQELDARLP
ncbi:AAA domain-containing protein [Azospirillum soli]|uniref:AAA domain-containing protein n=1 Tax=Azospirillum soli TaxID=1304799 RepID=UPI001AE3EEA4|nr:AAA domain-containing protein [Azospirillum soli]MBP2310738.1 superfamily I DNA and/or RNA helicase [Azospirillum soli]